MSYALRRILAILFVIVIALGWVVPEVEIRNCSEADTRNRSWSKTLFEKGCLNPLNVENNTYRSYYHKNLWLLSYYGK